MRSALPLDARLVLTWLSGLCIGTGNLARTTHTIVLTTPILPA